MNDPRQLTPFVEVVKSGSFAKAAKKLGITPSAISKNIAQLERNLGVRLVNRTTRRIHLTAEGDQLYSRISTLLAGIDAAISELRENAEQPTGRIRVSVGATFGRYSLIPALVEFLLQHPQVQLEVSFDDSPSSLIEKGFDIGIHHGHGSETSYVSRVLCEYPLILIASPAYLARKGVPKVPADLADHDCIGTITSAGQSAVWHLELAGRRRSKMRSGEIHSHTPNARLSIATQWDTNLTAALHGAGIAPTSLPAAMQFLTQKRLKIVLPNYRIYDPNKGLGQIFLLYPHREYMPSKLRAFVDFLIKWYDTHQLETSDLQGYGA